MSRIRPGLCAQRFVTSGGPALRSFSAVERGDTPADRPVPSAQHYLTNTRLVLSASANSSIVDRSDS